MEGGRCGRGVLHVLVAFISKPRRKVFELPELHGRAYAKCRPSEKERDALPHMDVDMDMEMAKAAQTAQRTADCVHA